MKMIGTTTKRSGMIFSALLYHVYPSYLDKMSVDDILRFEYWPDVLEGRGNCFYYELDLIIILDCKMNCTLWC